MQPAGRFRAVMTGLFKQDLNGAFSFKLVGTGNAQLFINDNLAATLTGGDGKAARRKPKTANSKPGTKTRGTGSVRKARR
jgi:hypothetical protein